MIKFLAILYKKPGISDEEFFKHWREIHAPLVAKLPFGVVKYKQDHLVKIPGIKYEDKDLLGIAEVWHDSIESFEKFVAWRETSDAKYFVDDENSFIDMSRIKHYRVEEHTIV